MNKKIISGALFAAVVTASGAANAAITSESILDFNPGMTFSAYAGFANNAPLADGSCVGTGAAGCFNDAGLVLGIVQDTSDPIAHVHRAGTSSDRSLMYHGDSSGIYIRAQDSTMFSLTSMDINSSASDENPDATGTYISADTGESVTSVAGANDYFEILGYSSALNIGLDTAANSGSWIARQTVANGFNGLLTLDSAFNNIGALWIHYAGYQQSPKDGKAFALELDNVKVNAAVSAVPVPAAVWLFGSGLMGFLYSAKRKASALVA